MPPSSHNPHRTRALTALLGVSVWSVLPAQGIPDSLPGGLDPRIDSLFAEYDHPWSPGCAIGIVKAGELVWQRGYGMADLEHGAPINKGTVFRLGSVSKQFTAAAVALLAAEGRLSLDADLRTYLPDFPTYARPITVSHLLHHLSGIRDYGGLMFLAGAKVDATYDGDDVYRMLIRQRGLDVSPGSAYGYSNSNYLLLARIIEAVTGEKFGRVLEQRIFAPLEMRSTRVQDDHTRLVPGRAVGYAPSGTAKGFRLNETWIDVVGAANVFTTIGDMARWDRNLDHPGLGEPALVDLLLTPGRRQNGDTVSYGGGTQLGRYRGLPTVGHAGAFAGHRADYVRFPDQRLAVVTLCNLASAAPWNAGRRVAGLILDDKMQPQVSATAPAQRPAPTATRPIPARIAARYAGRYRSEELGAVYQLELKGDSLSLLLPQPLRVPVQATDTIDLLRAVLPPAPMTIRFTRDTGGRITGFFLDAMRLRGLRFERVDGTP
jgi:CubicO group peptidase (beta-lactamase class C family)